MNPVWKRHSSLVVALAACCAMAAIPAEGAPPPVTLQPGLVKVAGGDLHGAAVHPVDGADKTWQTLLADGFEGTFPGETWTVLAYPDKPYWGRWSCWSGDTPTHSVGCAAAGPGAITCNNAYATDMYTWMIAGPFDFSNGAITAAELTCVVELMSEAPSDYLFMGVARDLDEGFWGETLGSFVFEQTLTLDLTDVTGFGSVVGEAQVWIGFLFVSDDFLEYTNGAQIDDVRLRVDQPLPNQAPLVHLTAPNGGELWSAGSQRTITYSASDPDGGPAALSIDLQYSLGDGSWHDIATGLANTGSRVWTVPAQESTNARVRVWADDGESSVSDMSDASFTIAIPGENVLSVGGGAGASGGSVVLPIALNNEDQVRGLQADLVFNGALASFGGIVAAGRGAGMTAEGADVGLGRVRILLFHDDLQTLAAGNGEVARITLNLQGPGGSTQVTPSAVVLAGPRAESWSSTVQGGTLQVTPPTSAPVVQIAALKNPGRTRSLHVMVVVIGGSGNPPSVTASGTPLVMTATGAAATFQGQVHVVAGATQVIIQASDTNVIGTGTDQVTIAWPQGEP